MSAQSIALRMLSSLSSVSQQKIRTGDYEASSKDTKNVTSAIEMMNDNDCHFYIDDTAAISPMDLRSLKGKPTNFNSHLSEAVPTSFSLKGSREM